MTINATPQSRHLQGAFLCRIEFFKGRKAYARMDKLSFHDRRRLGTVQLPNGETEGLDPREMQRSLLEQIGHAPRPLLRTIREKCLDCSQTASEVRRCTAVDCALWPYRMGTNPLRAERSEAQKVAAQKAAEHLRAYRSGAAQGVDEEDEAGD